MDADGVYFGDFGGGGGGAAGGKSSAQAKQDLMDTWYPDCRECACCKVWLALGPRPPPPGSVDRAYLARAIELFVAGPVSLGWVCQRQPHGTALDRGFR